ncbi:MAG: redox-regulated ATPase YchF [Firmicutes bacterium]|nr:redox-regulated ATPase YchF [Bacillota bacterium]
MKIGIVGLPQSGKTTLFQLLTNVELKANLQANTGIAKVLDPRITELSKIFQPKKTTYATIEVVDVAGLVVGVNKKENTLLNAIKDVDAVVQVLRAFRSDLVPTADGKIEPMRDLNQIQSELVLSDWSLLETRLERLEKERFKNKNYEKEKAVLTKCQEALEQDLPLWTLDFTDDEAKMIRGYNFLTLKPLLLVVNVDEEQMQRNTYPQQDELEAWAEERGIPIIIVSAQVEVEISQLEAEDRALFMADLGINESGIERLSRAAYAHLGLISYFTTGTDEVRAWTITQGTNAKQAAGKIHSDIERGFIRAEVVSYDDFIELGSIQKVKEKGLFRLEGKEYIVQDGDIISFRFNV